MVEFDSEMTKVARRVVAIDIDSNMLDVARDRLSKAGTTNCDVVEGDAYEPLSLCVPRLISCLWRTPFTASLISLDWHRLCARTLKPGGRFAVVNWHQRPREKTTVLGEPRGPKTELRMSPGQTIKSIKASGLIFAELVELLPYHYAVIFDRSSSVRPPV